MIFIALGVADRLLMLRYSRRRLATATTEAAEPAAAAALDRALLSPTEEAMRACTSLWFIIIAVFWIGFFVLEGFDFGVGALHMVVGRTEIGTPRRASTRSARSGTATRCG